LKKYLFFLCVSLLLFSCTYHPALRILKKHQKLEKINSVIPYIINLYAIHDLENSNKNVKPYLIWVLQNLNYPDKHGLTGSIYDRNITIDGIEFSTEGYDSIDSYSATFLILLHKYFIETNDREFLKENEKKIQDVAYTIAYLQDDDGLTSALPGSDIKYFMDNCEVYAGLKSFITLSEAMNWNLEEFYSNILSALEKGIWLKFYNPRNRNFNWAIDDLVTHESKWENHYPDAYAQIFPIAYNLPFENNKLKDDIWKKYVKLYKGNIKDLPPEQKVVVDFAEERMKK
jgi:hypothetical protein